MSIIEKAIAKVTGETIEKAGTNEQAKTIETANDKKAKESSPAIIKCPKCKGIATLGIERMKDNKILKQFKCPKCGVFSV